ncbi:catalase [Burkholderia sp. Ac-20365]|uniref:catalase n=1 Tax=Burkholderia sp. Ac-20365 TaxID=2703897 RepID=UPI00197B81C6|nr:catalase [Burkholderia sp. Ac-20365]MBN3761857.1 catalase [Burkholderia sp. Ac-20365]
MANETSPGASGQPSAIGTGWEDRPDTPDTLATLVGKIRAQQESIASSSKTGLNGRIDRGQHQKQLMGAFGTLRIFDTVPQALAAGPFANRGNSGAPLQYRAACRFSNGQPCPFADTEADVRGVAIKFFTPEGTETDLLATNEGGRSHTRDATTFMEIADLLIAQIEGGLTGLVGKATADTFSHKLGPVEAARSFGILAEATKLHKVASLTTETFWGSVVKLGDAAFKYALQPHPDTVPGTDGDPHGEQYLRDDLLNRVGKGALKWQLAVQLFTDEKHTPVNDASIVWEAPTVVIGELEISSAPSTDDEAAINQMAFNPGNGFEPLGITHARKAVYAASAANRKDRGLMSGEQARALIDKTR